MRHDTFIDVQPSTVEKCYNEKVGKDFFSKRRKKYTEWSKKSADKFLL